MTFNCVHFRTEFVRQSEANILRKLTMTQFMGILIVGGIGLMILDAPFWSAPLWIALGYVLGYNHNGEFVYKRVMAFAKVWLRLALGRPRIVNIQRQWDETRAAAYSQAYSVQAAVTIGDGEDSISY